MTFRLHNLLLLLLGHHGQIQTLFLWWLCSLCLVLGTKVVALESMLGLFLTCACFCKGPVSLIPIIFRVYISLLLIWYANRSELVQRIAINEIAESMMAFNTNYKDTGLFGVYAMCKVSIFFCIYHTAFCIALSWLQILLSSGCVWDMLNSTC